MPTVTMDGLGTAECEDGRRLVLCIEDAGVDILHRCGGNARCTTCRVEVLAGDAGPMTEAEREKMATVEDAGEDTRLSCQVQVRDDLTVRVLRRLQDFPDMDDSGPRPIEWPSSGPLPPE